MPTPAIPAIWMRGGTSKGLFFEPTDLPADAATRDALLLRAMGSPDPYGKQIDGLGGATSSTSKVVLVGASRRTDCDVDYWFGQVPISAGPIDWSGNCGNLTAAVGPFAVWRGLVAAPASGECRVRIWQANIGRRIVAGFPVRDGRPVEQGDFRLDGVAFPAAPVRLDFLDPAGGDERPLFPTGRLREALTAGPRRIEATLINAGNPMVVVNARDLGVDCAARSADLNASSGLLATCEAIRIAGSVAMGLAPDAAAAGQRGHTPKLALVGPPVAFQAADGRDVSTSDADLACRVLSMGQFHHAIPGTAAVALACAAAIPGTVAAALATREADPIRLAHPSGVTEVATALTGHGIATRIERVSMVRSARVLMTGEVFVASEAAASAGPTRTE
ncbi:MAG: 2-methylaconitate cis-trans isomerase PrpF [Rhodocyclaceae bacterium]|nr:2-methylaconitate cis-trans isomerase PrpF [Rhodocyclaceae bacterium]